MLPYQYLIHYSGLFISLKCKFQRFRTVSRAPLACVRIGVLQKEASLQGKEGGGVINVGKIIIFKIFPTASHREKKGRENERERGEKLPFF